MVHLYLAVAKINKPVLHPEPMSRRRCRRGGTWERVSLSTVVHSRRELKLYVGDIWYVTSRSLSLDLTQGGPLVPLNRRRDSRRQLCIRGRVNATDDGDTARVRISYMA